MANGSADLADGRLRDLLRSVNCFGLHLASLDLRQNSAVHESVISELFDVSIKSIEEINDFNESTLMPGQIIKIAIRAF